MSRPKTSSRTSRSVVEGLEARMTRLKEGARERRKGEDEIVYIQRRQKEKPEERREGGREGGKEEKYPYLCDTFCSSPR